MKKIQVENWQQFEQQIKQLQEDVESKAAKKEVSAYISPLLFRGHGDADWPLSTTLERSQWGKDSVLSYYNLIGAVRPQIESFIGSTLECPDFQEINKILEEADIRIPGKLPAYEYLIYLRHHGFPSPMLDWTRSEYVASLFAFTSPSAGASHVSVYAYQEYSGGFKMSSSDRPRIDHYGQYARAHRRHALQQSEYTVCLEGSSNQLRFASHESAFQDAYDGQDLLWKIDIPVSERLTALKHLDAFNLNPYSIFGTEESLMQTLALREMWFRRR